MKNWGIFLIIIGIICGYTAITMDTSVETGLGQRVNNLGLLNQQTNLLIGAGIAFISGILLIGFNSKSGSSSTDQIRTCPYCAEHVKAQATICRFCQKDLPVLEPHSLNQVTSSLPDASFDNLRYQIMMLKVGGFSYHMIAQDFNENNVPIPERHTEFETWSPELVKLVEKSTVGWVER